MELTAVIVGVACVWRITHLLHAEDGPGDIVVWLRLRAGVGFWGRLLDCFYCLSMWVAAPVAAVIADRLIEFALLWPGLSGAAILLERVTDRSSATRGGFVGGPASYVEDPLQEERDDET